MYGVTALNLDTSFLFLFIQALRCMHILFSWIACVQVVYLLIYLSIILNPCHMQECGNTLWDMKHFPINRSMKGILKRVLGLYFHEKCLQFDTEFQFFQNFLIHSYLELEVHWQSNDPNVMPGKVLLFLIKNGFPSLATTIHDVSSANNKLINLMINSTN